MIAYMLNALSRNRLSVFLFHKVPLEADPLVPLDLNLPTFQRTLYFVAEHFRVLPLEEAIVGMQNDRLPSNAACITFDDGYLGWRERVIPELEKRDAHATFFITTGQFDGMPMWHERVNQVVAQCSESELFIPGLGLRPLSLATLGDRKRAIYLLENHLKYLPLALREDFLLQMESLAKVSYRDLPVMSEEELRSIHGRGFGIGAHTVNHPILSQCSAKDAENEIAGSREVIEGIISARVTAFAYPNGRPGIDFSQAHVDMVKRAGYSTAVTTHWGAASSSSILPLQVPRFTPWGPSKSRMAIQVVRNLVSRIDTVSPGEDQTTAKPVRILSVENGAGFGGAIVALNTLLRNLPAHACEAHVATNMPVGDFSSVPAVRSTAVISDRLYDFRPLAKQLGQYLPYPLARPLQFGLGRLDDLFNRLPYLAKLLFHTWQLNPDVIHGNNEPSANREAMLVAKLLRKPYVQHVRGDLGVTRDQPWLLARPSVFIPVSRWLAGDLLMADVSVERIRQIYDAVDFSAPPSAGTEHPLHHQFELDRKIRLVAMVGMLVPWKGQSLFLDAVENLAKYNEIQNVRFLLIGDTPERGDTKFKEFLISQVREKGLTEHLIFAGKRDDLPQVMPEIDIVVSASTEPEPLGLVMLEAMYNRCIFVGPAHGAATEVVHHGQNGYLFKPGDANSLAASIREALQTIDTLSELRTRAQCDVTARFSGLACAAKTLQVFVDERRQNSG
jgi:glycosyltransferase involved in cell wall biosynthesis/peptidoglycan/xylan/chitin deacetylase (PgdA/CDA1 family)